MQFIFYFYKKRARFHYQFLGKEFFSNFLSAFVLEFLHSTWYKYLYISFFYSKSLNICLLLHYNISSWRTYLAVNLRLMHALYTCRYLTNMQNLCKYAVQVLASANTYRRDIWTHKSFPKKALTVKRTCVGG